MIEYILVMVFVISPPNMEPRTYELINRLDNLQNCMQFTKDLEQHFKPTEHLEFSSQCLVIEKSNTYSYHLIHEKKSRFNSKKVYDPYGKFVGSVNSRGEIFDVYGKRRGSVDSRGRLYNPHGKYKGTIYQRLFD